jgi:hypothetical protein
MPVAKAGCGGNFRVSLENYSHIFYPPRQIPEAQNQNGQFKGGMMV